MPTLTQYIVSRMAAAGYAPGDLSAVRWWDQAERRWRWLGVHQVKAAADVVDVSKIPNEVRELVQFIVAGESGEELRFVWDSAAGNFEPVGMKDDDFTVTADMLRGI